MSDDRPDANKTVSQVLDEVIDLAAEFADRIRLAADRTGGAASAEKPAPPMMDDSLKSKALLARLELRWLAPHLERLERSI